MPHRNANYNIAVTFRHTDSTEALKKYASDKVTQVLRKYIGADADVRVVLCVEKRDHIAEAIIVGNGYEVTGKASTIDLYSAIDKMVDHVDVQLRKQKEQRVDHKRHG